MAGSLSERPQASPSAIALVAVVSILAVQSIRVLIPMLYAVRESSGTPLALVIALVVFSAPFGAVPLRDHRARAARTSVIVLAVARFGMQIHHPIPVWLACVAAAVGLLALSLSLDGTGGATWIVGLMLGLDLDAAIHLWFRTWDYAWHGSASAMVVACAVSLGALALALLSQPASDPIERQPGWRASAIGAFLFIGLTFLFNPGFFSSLTGASAWVTSLACLAAGTLAVWAVVVTSRNALPPIAIAILSAAAIALGAYMPEAHGSIGAAASMAGTPVISALAGTAISSVARRKGDRSSSPAAMPFAFGALVFVLLAFGYQIAIDDPLPFPRWVFPVAATMILSFSAAGAQRAPVHVPRNLIAALGVIALLPALVVPPVLSLAGSSVATPTDPRIRVVDYNIHCAVDDVGDLDLQAIGASIAAQSPDIVVLQEVCRGWLIGGATDEASWLANRLGMNLAWAPAADHQFGNAVLTSFPILSATAVQLPYGAGPQHRSYVEATIDVGPTPLTVIGTHLQGAAGTSTRSDQVRAILAGWNGASDVIIAGDMNAQPKDPDIHLFKAAGLISAQDATGHTSLSTATDPRFASDRVDWIFGSEGVEFSGFVVGTSHASDHLPLGVTVRLRS